jgi:hypothetical protein
LPSHETTPPYKKPLLPEKNLPLPKKEPTWTTDETATVEE